MTSRLTAQVRDLARIYDTPVNTGTPTLDFPRVHFWIDLIGEEFSELVTAVYGAAAGQAVLAAFRDAVARMDEGTRDLVGAADALADIAVVDFGMAVEAGIPIDAVLDEVHRANLSKLGPDGTPVKDARGKWLKGPNYVPPDVTRVLRDAA